MTITRCAEHKILYINTLLDILWSLIRHSIRTHVDPIHFSHLSNNLHLTFIRHLLPATPFFAPDLNNPIEKPIQLFGGHHCYYLPESDMGLIKTGMQIGGAYAVINSGSKAFDKHEKTKLENQRQQQLPPQSMNFCQNPLRQTAPLYTIPE